MTRSIEGVDRIDEDRALDRLQNLGDSWGRLRKSDPFRGALDFFWWKIWAIGRGRDLVGGFDVNDGAIFEVKGREFCHIRAFS